MGKSKYTKKIKLNKTIKTKKQKSYTIKNSKTKSTKSIVQKTVRIIFLYSPGKDNDAKIYKNEFIKQNYKVDFKIIEDIKHNHIEKYYDINLFVEDLPFNCKNIFPAKIHLFMPNIELFIDSNSNIYNIHTKNNNDNDNDNISSKSSKTKNRYQKHKNDDYKGIVLYDRYEELKSLDFILCKTKLCENLFNFIKNENKNTRKYKYETIYTKFTSIIGKDFINIFDNNDPTYIKNLIDPNLFMHLAGQSNFKNTSDLIYCWIKNKGFLNIDPDIKLVITCFEHCAFSFNNLLKSFYKYDFEKDPAVNINYKTNTAIYKNMTIYFKPLQPFKKYIDIITKANVSICISSKEGYGHYINEARYMKKFIITLDNPPMNELVVDKNNKSGNGNGLVLQKKNKFSTQTYKETKFKFIEAYPDMDELRDSIIWCIKHKYELRKWGNHGRQMFLNDKKYFEDNMEKFIRNKL
jgi:hypothetical protein